MSPCTGEINYIYRMQVLDGFGRGRAFPWDSDRIRRLGSLNTRNRKVVVRDIANRLVHMTKDWRYVRLGSEPPPRATRNKVVKCTRGH